MKYTNKTGLSQSIADAIIAFAGDYDKVGWQSVTTLIDAPRAQLLRQRHEDEITEDIADLLWIFFGNMGHLIAERYADAGSIAEKRFILNFMDVELSLKPDLLARDPNEFNVFELQDFKFTSIYVLKAALQGRVKIEWERQMNVYVWALRKLGVEINKISLQVIARDWRGSEALREVGYPATPCGVIKIGIWDEKKAEDYITERINLYKKCMELSDDDLPECTQEERWADPDRWAIVKASSVESKNSGYRKALPKASGFLSRSEAALFMSKRDDYKDLLIEYRKGESRRCQRGYCKVASHCSQFRTSIAPAF